MATVSISVYIHALCSVSEYVICNLFDLLVVDSGKRETSGFESLFEQNMLLLSCPLL